MATHEYSAIARRVGPSDVCFMLFGISSIAILWAPLSALVRFSFQHEYCSHIILIPLVSASLIFLERRKIFLNVRYGFGVGSALLLAGISLYWLGQTFSSSLTENDRLSATIFAAVVLWLGGFIFCYGTHAFRAAMFPLLFLLLMIPIPSFLLEKAIFLLQKGSTEAASLFFRLSGVPVYREGFVLALPGINIEVAKQCSGIRSSLALIITCLLAGYLCLRSGWRRVLLLLCSLPIVIVKNGLRIFTLSMLGIYVDARFLSSSPHRNGGILFFLLALVILAPVLRFLQKSENTAQSVKVRTTVATREKSVPEVPSLR